MPFQVLLFAHRKAGITPSEFRDHLEGPHITLLKELFGPLFPLSHVRRYLQRDSSDEPYPATVLVGTQEDFEYDVISELTFEDESAFRAFFGKYQSEEIAAAIQEDETQFLDSARMKAVVVGHVEETTRQ